MDKMKRLAADDGGERRRTTSFNTDAGGANGGTSASSHIKSTYLEDGTKVTTVMATSQKGERCQMTFAENKVIGNGSFGVVSLAQLCDEKKTPVAIKKVLQDRRYKNRELQIMRQLSHCNVVHLLYFFYSAGERDDVYLHLVLEFVPETVYRACRNYTKMKQSMPTIYVQLYTYQMYRSLAYIHGTGICHRDIKPQNLLIDQNTGVLKLCDFGSAKVLVRGEPNVSYICSRYYRAPELIFGASEYTTAIDIWSGACVMSELLIGQPIFPGESGVDQLVEIIKVLGTPTREQILAMNKNYTEFKFPQIKPSPWSKVFHAGAPEAALNLINRTLNYEPENRLTAVGCCADPFFDDLRNPNTRLPNGNPLPPLFNFVPEELKGITDAQRQRLMPKSAR